MQILGHGVDVIECPRVSQLLENHGPRFLERVFTSQEWQYCQQHKETAQRLAGRFAAKEAVLKALGTGMRGRMKWTDVRISNDDLGKPENVDLVAHEGGHEVDLSSLLEFFETHLAGKGK